ncbi:hypothetical protein ENBRE01_1254 [Enteropsectra breve]|nr:hypothetical protein ENBRE01_1254 [Enteropsectra breve]
MENTIEDFLERQNFTTNEELKEFSRQANKLIAEYEKHACVLEDPDEHTSDKIKAWRKRVFQIIKENKKIDQPVDDSKGGEGIETLRLINRQMQHAEKNQALLDKSTLKLIGLDYTCDDIAKAVKETSKKIGKRNIIEQKERRNLTLAFGLFIMICVFILIDKIRIKVAS